MSDHVTVTYEVTVEADTEEEARLYAIRETVESRLLVPDVYIETDEELARKAARP